MAGRPIVIEFASNVRDFLRGTRDVERSTEDIGDSLKDASRDSERFEREFRDSMKDAERQAGKTSRNIEQDFDKTPGKLGEIGEDAGGEFVQNIGEAVSSGDVGGLIEGTLGGIVSGLKGPMGLAAAGLAGVAVLAFQKVRDEAEALNAFYESWQESFLGLVYATGDALTAAAVEADYASWLQDMNDKLVEFSPLLADIKLDSETFWRNLYAGGDSAEDLLGYLSAVVDQGYAAELEGGDQALIDAKNAAQQIIPEVKKIVDGTDDATASGKAYSDAMGKDALGAAEDVLDQWIENDRFFREKAAIPVRQKWIIETEVTGPGAAAIPNPGARTTPSMRGATPGRPRR